MHILWPFPFLLPNFYIKVLAAPSPAWLLETRSTSTIQLPYNVSSPRTLDDPAPRHFHVPDSLTDLVITPGDPVDAATLNTLLRGAKSVIESLPSSQEADTPWFYTNAFLRARLMIDAAPGHRISWGVISDVVRGLYTYSVVRPIFCSFDVLQEVKVGYGFTGRIEGPVASSQLPTSLLNPNVTRQRNIPVDVPGTQTRLILNLDGPVPVRDLDSLLQSAQGFAEYMLPEEASDNPWVYPIDLGVRVVVRTSPGAHLPWVVMYHALEGLEDYFVGPPMHGNFCHFRIFEAGVLVGTGVTERVPQPPDNPSASPVGPTRIESPSGTGIAAS